MSKHESHESHLRSTCTALLLAALAGCGCQYGVIPQDKKGNALDANGAAEALTESVQPTAEGEPPAARVQQSVTDQALKLRLNDALIFDPLLPPSEISLTVKQGHVKLTGAVGAFFDSVQAAAVVSRVSGVSSIDNQLEVRQPGTALCVLGTP